MTYNEHTYQHRAHTAYYTPSVPYAPTDGYQRQQQPASVILSVHAMLVRYTTDDILGGFWREADHHVDFIPYRSAEGERTLEALVLLGVSVRRA